jgi:hypothetical protein
MAQSWTKWRAIKLAWELLPPEDRNGSVYALVKGWLLAIQYALFAPFNDPGNVGTVGDLYNKAAVVWQSIETTPDSVGMMIRLNRDPRLLGLYLPFGNINRGYNGSGDEFTIIFQDGKLYWGKTVQYNTISAGKGGIYGDMQADIPSFPSDITDGVTSYTAQSLHAGTYIDGLVSDASETRFYQMHFYVLGTGSINSLRYIGIDGVEVADVYLPVWTIQLVNEVPKRNEAVYSDAEQLVGYVNAPVYSDDYGTVDNAPCYADDELDEGLDFSVILPGDLILGSGDELERNKNYVRSVVDQYKFAGTRYQVKTWNEYYS